MDTSSCWPAHRSTDRGPDLLRAQRYSFLARTSLGGDEDIPVRSPVFGEDIDPHMAKLTGISPVLLGDPPAVT